MSGAERATSPRDKTRKSNLARLHPPPIHERIGTPVRSPVPNRATRRLPAEASGPNDRPPCPRRLCLRPRLQFEFDRETRQCDARHPPFSTAFSIRLDSLRSISSPISVDRPLLFLPFFPSLSVGRSAEIFPGREKIQVGGERSAAGRGERCKEQPSSIQLVEAGVNLERERESVREIGCEAWGSRIGELIEPRDLSRIFRASVCAFFRFLPCSFVLPVFFLAGAAGGGVVVSRRGRGLASSRCVLLLLLLSFL